MQFHVKHIKSVTHKIEKERAFCSDFSSCLFVLLLAVFSFSSFVIRAQDTIKRPKIGLVLSGGGAKGFAHIGVLKVLEREGVKIDYITGTSMGAVVGGLYAIGYSAEQIDSIFHSTNFDELLKDFVPRTSKSFYEKRNDELYAVSLPFDGFTIGVPMGLSKGVYNYNLLAKLTHSVRHVRDFNKFPIPFLCVATNVETGKQQILDSGYLPKALLATSAFPTLFSPVELDGNLLVDGGAVNNYPIDEVRKMGADIVIGVDVQDGLKDRKSLQGAAKILLQLTNIQMTEGMTDKIKQTDIYIKPDISSFSVISFDEGREIIDRGEEAALDFIDSLEKLASNYNEGKRKGLSCKNDSIQVDKISINKLYNYSRAYVIGKLGFKQGAKITYDQLKKGVNTLNATGNFNSINYELNDLTTGDELSLNLTESTNRSFLKFGLHYDGLYKSAALVNFTRKRLLFKNDVLSVDLGAGDNFRYNLDYYIDNGFYFSLGFKSRLNQFNKNVSIDLFNGVLPDQFTTNTLNIDYQDFNNQAYIQTVFVQKFLLGTGLEWKHLKISSETLREENPNIENSDYISFFGYLKYDSFDNKYFPKKGWFFDGNFQSFLYSTNYTNRFERFSILKGEAGISQTFFKKFNLKIESEAGMHFGQESVPFLDFFLGGYGFNAINNFRPFYGLDFVSLVAKNYVKGAATLDFEFYKKNHLNFSANFANIEDNLFKTKNWLSSPSYSGYALGYGLETVIGPIEIKYSWSPDVVSGFVYVNIGFWF